MLNNSLTENFKQDMQDIAYPGGSSSKSSSEVQVELVSEEQLDGGLSAEKAPEYIDLSSEEIIENFKERLSSIGYPIEDHRRSPGSFFMFRWGKHADARLVRVDAERAEFMLTMNLSDWKTLKRYDGLWNSKDKTIEVFIRGDGLAPSSVLLSNLVDRLMPERAAEENIFLEFSDPKSNLTVRFGNASEEIRLLDKLPWRAKRAISMKVFATSAVDTIEQADQLIERLSDAISVDMTLATGMALLPSRLVEQPIAIQKRTSSNGCKQLSFPINSYPHAAVTLYHSGRDRRASPLIRYWAFYQVLEYFFTHYSELELTQRLASQLKDPTFDPHDIEDVRKIVALASSSKQQQQERDQLHATLRGIVTPEEVVQEIEDLGLVDHLKGKNLEPSNQQVRATPQNSSNVLHELTLRIYDIRCRIVHSKSNKDVSDFSGLLPGTHHDDLIRKELPLIQYLAEKALINSAQRLAL